jgi:hypothetical protein
MRLRPLAAVPALALLALVAGCGPGGGATVTGQPIKRAQTATASPQTADDSPLSALVPYPGGASPWVHNKTGQLTLDEFLDNFYASDARKDEKTLMLQRGFRTAVRRGWIGADNTQSDVWIVTFKDAAGARSMYLGLTSGWKDGKDPVFTDAAVGGTGQTESSLDDLGNADAKVVAPVGDRVMYVRYYTAARPSKGGAEALAAQQYARLQG